MSTTVFFVEHIISGIQACLWVLVLLACFLGIPVQITNVQTIGTEGLVVTSLILLAIVYPLGISIDEVADFLFRKWGEPIRRDIFLQEGLELTDTVFGLRLRSENSWTSEYFTYLRTRIRICRSTALNSVLLVIALMLTFIPGAKWDEVVEWPATAAGIAIAAMFALLSNYAWRCMSITLFKKTVEAYRVLDAISRKESAVPA